jgi:hypothetical protein
MEADFETLGSGPAYNRQMWLANVDSAVAAATLAQVETLTPVAVAYFAEAGRQGGRQSQTLGEGW